MICFVAVDPPEVLLARDGREEHLAAPLALADGPHLHPRGRRGERAEVGVDVFRVRELLGRADDIAQRLLRRGDGVRRGQVVDELGEEERLGRVLADLRGVVGVDRLRRRIVGPGGPGSWRAAGRSEATARACEASSEWSPETSGRLPVVRCAVDGRFSRTLSTNSQRKSLGDRSATSSSRTEGVVESKK